MARVLVVDDEPDILFVLRVALEDQGHEVVMAADGRMGLDRLASERPDVVVLDMMMPVVDGAGVLGEMRERADATPVVVVSARSGVTDRRRALELGALEYVVKPFDLDRLLELVAEVLEEDGDTREQRRQQALGAL
jgi:DNA-binding response OmpR family regulator